MIERDEQQLTSDPVPQAGSDNSSTLVSAPRRRLMRGTALALPAIITLHYGRAVAAQSVTCVQKNGTYKPSVPAGVDHAVSMNDGQYEREAVDTYYCNNVAVYYVDKHLNIPRDIITGDPLHSLPTCSSGLVKGDSYYALVYRYAKIDDPTFPKGNPFSNGPVAGENVSWNSVTCLHSLGL